MQNLNGVETYQITVKSPGYSSYRAERVRSMFNVTAEQGSSHTIDVSLPLGEKEWQIGAVIGGSGTGKSTLGDRLLGGGKIHHGFDWDSSKPVIDQIGTTSTFDEVTGALASVGLGTVPSWLRPFHVLSQGEKFRAEMARLILEKPSGVVIDEFTSVVDRQIARVGSAAFGKAWRRTGGKVIVLSCHKDFTEWLCPDWVLDTDDWEFSWRSLRRRPPIDVKVYECNSKAWSFFKKHHYLDLPLPVAATYYVGVVGDQPVAHLAVSTISGMKQSRLTRLVIAPEWQGAGVGMRFLECVASMWAKGENRYKKPLPGIIHTSHPGLIAALARSSSWTLVSQQVGGANRAKSVASIAKAQKKAGVKSGTGGFGGHIRAVSGFRYVGG